jgi:hypothetical protein
VESLFFALGGSVSLFVSASGFELGGCAAEYCPRFQLELIVGYHNYNIIIILA